MKFQRSPKGFTLIELLVVISIIAILASLAIPASIGVVERANQMKSVSNAKNIYLGLKMYSGDNDGNFPGTAATPDSNTAFRSVVPAYLASEKVFYVSSAKFYTKTSPDDNTAGAEALKAGENAYAFVEGLSDSSNPSYPLIADGFSAVPGTYAADPNAAGGVWKGKAAVVVRVDGSAKTERCDATYQVVGAVGTAATANIFTLRAAAGADTGWIPGTIILHPIAAP